MIRFFLYFGLIIFSVVSCKSKPADSKEISSKVDAMYEAQKLEIENSGSAECEKLIAAELQNIKKNGGDKQQKLAELKVKANEASKAKVELKKNLNASGANFSPASEPEISEIDKAKEELKNSQNDLLNSTK